MQSMIVRVPDRESQTLSLVTVKLVPRVLTGTMQLISRFPPHPAPKRHGAGLSPERARQDHRLVPMPLCLIPEFT